MTSDFGDKTTYNRTINRLKVKLEDIRERSFNECVADLNRIDNSAKRSTKT